MDPQNQTPAEAAPEMPSTAAAPEIPPAAAAPETAALATPEVAVATVSQAPGPQFAPPPGAPPSFAAWTLPVTPAQPAVKRPLSRGRVLVAAGAVLSIAVGAGVGVAIVQHREDHNNQVIAAARAAAAARPAPLTGGVRSDGSHYGALFAYLLPMPSGYQPGPYDANYGDDSYTPASQITSQLEDLLSGVPKSDMSGVKGALANTHLKGVAIRTMRDSTSTSAQTVSIELLQFDVKDAKSAAHDFDDLVSNLNVFRTGAAVPGYAQAKCVLPPGLGSDKVDEMLCVASSGDIEVMVDAQGTTPFDQNSVAALVARQLDRLKTAQSVDQ